MKFTTAGKQDICIGMYWARLSGQKPKAELILLSTEVEKRNGFVRNVVTDESKVLQAALISDNDQKGLISGAAAIADLYQEIIFAADIGGDAFWICAVSGHEVLAGGDKIVQRDYLRSEIEGILSSFSEGEEPGIVVSNESIADEIGLRISSVKNFDQLIEDGDVEKFSSSFSQYRVQKIAAGANKLIVYAGVISIGLMAFQIIGPGFGQKKPVLVDTPEIDFAAIAEQDRQRAALQEAELLNKAKQEEIDWLTSDIIAIENFKYLESTYRILSRYPRFVGGWEIEKALYSNVNKEYIQIFWKRQPLGNASSLRNSLGESAITKIDLSGDAAVSYIKLDISPTESGDLLTDVVANNQYSVESFINDFQLIGVNWKFNEIERTPRPVQIQGIVDQKKSMDRQLSISGKMVDISGVGDVALFSTIGSIKLSRVFKVSTFVIKADDYSWKINGEFYEDVK